MLQIVLKFKRLQLKQQQDARLRSEPNTSSQILKTYNADDVLFVTSSAQGTDGVWYELNDGEGNVGWMREDVITLS